MPEVSKRTMGRRWARVARAAKAVANHAAICEPCRGALTQRMEPAPECEEGCDLVLTWVLAEQALGLEKHARWLPAASKDLRDQPAKQGG